MKNDRIEKLNEIKNLISLKTLSKITCLVISLL